jgi:hypothetical protein
MDRHRFDADLDPNPNLHFDVNLESDQDWHLKDADPRAYFGSNDADPTRSASGSTTRLFSLVYCCDWE